MHVWRKVIRAAVALALTCGGLVPLASASGTASIYLSPSSGTHAVGKTFNVGVYVSSDAQSMNAATASLSYPSNLLQAVSIGKGGSIVNLWLQEPSFSNGTGTARLEGIVLNPGYQGKSGLLLTVTFKAIAAGTADVRITTGEVLANDGQGTNILSGFGSAKYVITTPTVAPPAEPGVPQPPPAATTLPAPDIFSTTHADRNRWYPVNDVNVSWKMPPGATGASVIIDQRPDTAAPAKSEGAIAEKAFSDVADGVWYAHVRLQGAAGWGPTGHFPLRIDTTPPTVPALRLASGAERADRRPTVWAEGSDALSGLEYYAIRWSGSESVRVAPDQASQDVPYAFIPVRAGVQDVTVQAFDKAGNSSETAGQVELAATVPPYLDTPNDIEDGQGIAFTGRTYGSSLVTVILLDGDEREREIQVASRPDGTFALDWPHRLMLGAYEVTATVNDPNGLESARGDLLPFQVVPSAGAELRELTKGYRILLWASIIVIAFLLLLLIALAAYASRLRAALFALVGFKGNDEDFLRRLEADLRAAVALGDRIPKQLLKRMGYDHEKVLDILGEGKKRKEAKDDRASR